MHTKLGSMALMALMALALVVAGPAPALGDGGGTTDSTGLVWSMSQKLETGSWWYWDSANANAANYWVVEDGVTYDDWRLPTVQELQGAILDGTMNLIVPRTPQGPYYYDILIWSADTRGAKAWTVLVQRDETTLNVTGGGATYLKTKRLFATEVFFVRGRPPQ
jgi:hypothetical protein